jgi:hypothetical protein
MIVEKIVRNLSEVAKIPVSIVKILLKSSEDTGNLWFSQILAMAITGLWG